MKITNLPEVIEALRQRLPQYLKMHGVVDHTRSFRCLHSSHTDEHPSANLIARSGYTVGYCHVCKASFDTFTLANWFDHLPAQGPGWILETVPQLADILGVAIEYAPPTEEEQQALRVYKAYRDSSYYVSNPHTGEWTKDVEQYISQHNWGKKDLSEHGIGVASEEEYASYMLGLGYDIEYLQEVGLIPSYGGDLRTPKLIAENQLVFTIRDEYNRPIAFAARRFADGPKYINTGKTGLSHDIYNKRARLYGLETAKTPCRAGRPLYLFEGYGDVHSARLAGIPNCAAVCGTGLTEDHLTTLNNLDLRHVILCFDFDDAGQEALKRVIETIVPLATNIRFEVVFSSLEEQGKDPADIIEQTGSEKFLSLRKAPSFIWLLERLIGQGLTNADVANRLVPIIAAEPNAIIRDTYINKLSTETEVAKYAIEIEVRKLTEAEQSRREATKKSLTNKLIRELEQSADGPVPILEKYTTQFEDLDAEFNQGRYSAMSFVHMLDKQKAFELDKDARETPGFYLRFMPEMHKALSDGTDWRYAHLLMVGGEEGRGKTSWLTFFLYNIASFEKNDAVCIYWSIDDAGERVLPKFVTVANAELQGQVPITPDSPYLSINHVVNPKHSIKMLPPVQAKEIINRREAAYERLYELAAAERLLIKDAKEGNTLTFAKGIIRHFRNKYPSRPITFVIDNTHNLSDYQYMTDAHSRFGLIANDMKDLCTRYDATIIASVEYRKRQSDIEPRDIIPPNNDRIKETASFKYRADWIGHIYNDIKERPTRNQIYHIDPLTREKLPRIILYHTKSKINGFSGPKFLNFYPAYSCFTEVSESETWMDYELVKEREQEHDERYRD